MECLDENTIVEFIQGTLSVRDARAVEEHVDGCPTCRLLLSELAKTSFAVPHPDSAVSPPPIPEEEESYPTDPSASMKGLHVGQVVAGRYRVVRFLGKGAMGRVYEVDDLQLQDRVALKLLRPEVKDIPRLLEHLRHEVVLGRRISHPNVCRLHDIGTFSGNYFITMSLVHGENLSAILSREVPPPAWAVGVLLQICAALEAAHEQGVVHRDLKCSNIMVDTKGKVTVMDFGLARDLWSEASQSGMLVGSPAYWSPEQACGHRATERSDIYSFGVVACELFGARRPMFGKLDLARVPASYRPLVQRCLQPEAEDRFASTRELRQALEAAGQAPRKSRRWGWAVAAGSLVVVAGVGVGYWAWPWPPAPSASEAGGITVVALRPDAALPRVAALTPASPDADAAAAPASKPPAAHVAPRGVRRPRPGHRHRATPTAPAPSTPAKDAAPPAPDPRELAKRKAQAQLEELGRRRQQVEDRRVKAGILLDDLPPTYRGALNRAKAALAAADVPSSLQAVERLQKVLDGTRIDKAFISRKLARLSALKSSRKLDEARAKRAHQAFAKVHASYFAGDYQAANAHLNRLWHVLQQAEGGTR
jgi:hypothetical protein